jgi:enoyl-CoA hydratase
MSNLLTLRREGDALIIRFTRPEIRNPLSISVLNELNSVLDMLTSDVRKIVFTGGADVFASGADLREIAQITGSDAEEFALRGQHVMNTVAGLEQLTIAAINGFCFGGALDLALACDLRFATVSAKFAHPGTGLGIITGWGGTQRLPRLIGTWASLEMLFTAEPIDAARALSIGLIDEIADDPLTRALETPAGEAI